MPFIDLDKIEEKEITGTFYRECETIRAFADIKLTGKWVEFHGSKILDSSNREN